MNQEDSRQYGYEEVLQDITVVGYWGNDPLSSQIHRGDS